MSTAAQTRPQAASRAQWVDVLVATTVTFGVIGFGPAANAALADLRGALGLAPHSGAWIGTAYAVGRIMIIPVAPWLAGLFSIRRVFLASLLGFVLASIACGLAPTGESLIALRFVQGLAIGATTPLTMMLILTTFAPGRRLPALVVFAIIITAPQGLGIAFTGWIDTALNWRWLFFADAAAAALLVGVMALFGTRTSEPARWRDIAHADGWGMLAVVTALTLATIVVALGHRPEYDWFASALIVGLTAAAAIALTLAVWIELTHARPFLRLDLLAVGNFTITLVLITLVLRFGLQGSYVVLARYLSQVQGYRPSETGPLIFWLNLPQFLLVPVLGWIISRFQFDLRYAVALGLTIFAGAAAYNTQITHTWAFDQFIGGQLIQAIGLALIVLPMVITGVAAVQPHQGPTAGAVFISLLTLNQQAETSILTTLVGHRTQIRAGELAAAISPYRAPVQERIANLGGTLNTGTPPTHALAQIAGMVQREAAVLAYHDVFVVVAFVLLAGLLLIPLLRYTPNTATRPIDWRGFARRFYQHRGPSLE